MVSAESLPGYVKVSVVDDGIGIPEKDIPQVFERFFQVESHLTRHHGGMGLGLFVAKVMTELHSGQIWVESIEGKGSNFSFLLPSGKVTTNAFIGLSES
jgi:signal transduction histidine kinase